MVTCKKSPQAWGLKAEAIKAHVVPEDDNLQKESPSMGIESFTPPAGRGRGHPDLQKESPSMGIESKLNVFWLSYRITLQKESPSMGIESSPLTLHLNIHSILHLQKESPSMGIESAVCGMVGQAQHKALQKESPSMGIERRKAGGT